MTRSHKVLGFLLVSILGVYGCAKGPAGRPNDHSTAEEKVKRLEEDLRAASQARDSFRQSLLAAEEKQAQLQRQIDQANATAAKERQERELLKTELKTRIAERDTLQTQYEGFRKSIRELLGQAEAAIQSPQSPSPAQVGTQTSALEKLEESFAN